jgi:hypothetical protein
MLKLLTDNQVLASGHPAIGAANDECPGLHQLVHQRLRTTMDILRPEPHDEAPPRTSFK